MVEKQPFDSVSRYGEGIEEERRGFDSRRVHHRNFRDVAQFGSAPALGAGSRWFKPSHPDHIRDVAKFDNATAMRAGDAGSSQAIPNKRGVVT